VGDDYDHEYVGIHMQPDEATGRAFTVYNPEHPLSRAVAELPLHVVVFVHDEARAIDLTDAAESPHVELVRTAELVVLDLTDDELMIDLTSGEGSEIDLEGWLSGVRR